MITQGHSILKTTPVGLPVKNSMFLLPSHSSPRRTLDHLHDIRGLHPLDQSGQPGSGWQAAAAPLHQPDRSLCSCPPHLPGTADAGWNRFQAHLSEGLYPARSRSGKQDLSCQYATRGIVQTGERELSIYVKHPLDILPFTCDGTHCCSAGLFRHMACTKAANW